MLPCSFYGVVTVGPCFLLVNPKKTMREQKFFCDPTLLVCLGFKFMKLVCWEWAFKKWKIYSRKIHVPWKSIGWKMCLLLKQSPLKGDIPLVFRGKTAFLCHGWQRRHVCFPMDKRLSALPTHRPCIHPTELKHPKCAARGCPTFIGMRKSLYYFRYVFLGAFWEAHDKWCFLNKGARWSSSKIWPLR